MHYWALVFWRRPALLFVTNTLCIVMSDASNMLKTVLISIAMSRQSLNKLNIYNYRYVLLIQSDCDYRRYYLNMKQCCFDNYLSFCFISVLFQRNRWDATLSFCPEMKVAVTRPLMASILPRTRQSILKLLEFIPLNHSLTVTTYEQRCFHVYTVSTRRRRCCTSTPYAFSCKYRQLQRCFRLEVIFENNNVLIPQF